MASITVTYSFTNGTASDATAVNTNFNDIISGTSDGTKDFSISALTCAGIATFNGNVLLGNASGDDVQFNGSLATSIPIKTTRTYDIGSADLGLRIIYLGMNSTYTIALCGPSSGASADYTLTLPATDGATGDVLTNSDGSATMAWWRSGRVTIDNAAGTAGVTLASTDEAFQYFNPSSAITVKLDNSFTNGDVITIYNDGTAEISLTANDNAVIATIYRKTCFTVRCKTTTPTTNTSWLGCTPIVSPTIEITSLFTSTSFTGLGTANDWWVNFSRRGSRIYVEGWAEAGTITASAATIIMPSGMAINTTFYENTHHHLGIWGTHRATSWMSSGDGGKLTYDSGQGSDRICLTRDGNNDAISAMAANAVFSNSQTFSFEASYEVSGWGTYSG